MPKMQVFENVAKLSFRNQFQFTPDGRSLVLGALPVTLIDTTDGSCRELLGMKGRWAWAFVRNGKAIAYLPAANEDVRIFDPKTCQEQIVGAAHLKIREMVATPNGEKLYLSPGAPHRGTDARIWVLNAADLTLQAEPMSAVETVHRLCISADGNWLAARHSPGSHLRAWHVGGKTLPRKESMCVAKKYTNDFALSADGSYLAAVSHTGLSVWETSGGEEVVRSGKHRRSVLALACNPVKPILATGDNAGQIFLWDYAGQVLTRFDWKLKEVCGLTFAPDGLRCAAVDSTGKVVIWDVDV
jgi:WD40 repeat protein